MSKDECNATPAIMLDHSKQLSALKVQMDIVVPIMKNMDKILCRGNGVPSAVAQIAENKKSIEDHTNEERRRHGSFLWKVGLLITVLLTLFTTGVAFYMHSNQPSQLTPEEVVLIVKEVAKP